MIQVYTGDGKGKTTAAIGLTVRALGAGRRVYMAQFVKDRDTSEAEPLRRLGATVEQFGHGMILGREATREDRAAAAAGLTAVREQVRRAAYDLIIMDEANVAAKLGVISVDDIIDLMSMNAADRELVITGRDADARVIERADLVSEMRAVKHYFDQGIDARLGVEY